MLSVYLHLLDFIADPSNEPNKARGSARHVLSAKNDWFSCRGKAYDTTASISSDKNGVQAELAKYAPDAESRLLRSFDQPRYMPCLHAK